MFPSCTQGAYPTGKILQVLCVQKPLLKVMTFYLEQEGQGWETYSLGRGICEESMSM